MSDGPKRKQKKVGFRGLMLALADTTPEELSSDILIRLAAMFFKLAAQEIAKEK